MSILLEPSDVAELTGRKTKSGQVAQLRSAGLLLHINARNYPVVPKSAIDKSPPDVNVIKLFYLALSNIAKKWSMPLRDWKSALNRFTIQFNERMPRHY